MGITGGFYIISFGYLLPFLLSEFGWNRGTTSLAAAINLIAMGLCGPIAGFFIVKYGARLSMILGNILGFAGLFLLFLHTRLWELFLGYGLLIGLGAGFGGMLASTTVINNWFVKRRGLALSIFLSSSGAAGIFMGPAIMKLIKTAGWSTTVLTMACAVLLLAVLLPAIFIKNKPQDIGQVPDGPGSLNPPIKSHATRSEASYRTPVDFTAKEAMRTKSLWLLIAYFCMNMLAMQALMTHQIAFLLDIGIDATLAAGALSLMSAVMTLSQLGVGFISRRFGMHSIAVCAESFKIAGLMILIIVILLVKAMPHVYVLAGVGLYMIVLGLGFGAVMTATMNIFPNYFGISNYPKIMGFVRLFWAFIGGAGAPIAGYIREMTGSYLPAFCGVLAVTTLGLICLIFARAPVHPSLKEMQRQ